MGHSNVSSRMASALARQICCLAFLFGFFLLFCFFTSDKNNTKTKITMMSEDCEQQSSAELEEEETTSLMDTADTDNSIIMSTLNTLGGASTSSPSSQKQRPPPKTPSRLEELRARTQKLRLSSHEKLQKSRKMMLEMHHQGGDAPPYQNEGDSMTIEQADDDTTGDVDYGQPHTNPFSSSGSTSSLPQHEQIMMENQKLKSQLEESHIVVADLRKELAEARDELESTQEQLLQQPWSDPDLALKNEALTDRILDLEAVNTTLREQHSKFLQEQRENHQRNKRSILDGGEDPYPSLTVDMLKTSNPEQLQQHLDDLTSMQPDIGNNASSLEDCQKLNRKLSMVVQQLNIKNRDLETHNGELVSELQTVRSEGQHKGDLLTSLSKELQDALRRESEIQQELELAKKQQQQEPSSSTSESISSPSRDSNHKEEADIEGTATAVEAQDYPNSEVLDTRSMNAETANEQSSADDDEETLKRIRRLNNDLTAQNEELQQRVSKSEKMNEALQKRIDEVTTLSKGVGDGDGGAVDTSMETTDESYLLNTSVLSADIESLHEQITSNLENTDKHINELGIRSNSHDEDDEEDGHNNRDLTVRHSLSSDKRAMAGVLKQLARMKAQYATQEMKLGKLSEELHVETSSHQQETAKLIGENKNLATQVETLVKELEATRLANADLTQRISVLEAMFQTLQDLRSNENEVAAAQSIDETSTPIVEEHDDPSVVRSLTKQVQHLELKVGTYEKVLKEYANAKGGATADNSIEVTISDDPETTSPTEEENEQLQSNAESLEITNSMLEPIALHTSAAGQSSSEDNVDNRLQQHPSQSDSTQHVNDELVSAHMKNRELLKQVREMDEGTDSPLSAEIAKISTEVDSDVSKLSSKLVELEARNLEFVSFMETLMLDAESSQLLEEIGNQVQQSSLALISSQLVEAALRRSSLEADLDDTLNRMGTLTAVGNEREDMLALTEEELENARLVNVWKQLEDARVANSNLTDEVEDLRLKVGTLEASNQQLETVAANSESVDLLTELAESALRISSLEEELVQAQGRLDENADELDRAWSTNMELTDQMKILQSNVGTLEGTNKDLVSEVESLALQAESVELEEILQRSTGKIMSAQLAETSERSSSLQAMLAETMERLDYATTAAEENDKTLFRMRNDLDQANLTNQQLTDQIETLQLKIGSLEGINKELVDEVESLALQFEFAELEAEVVEQLNRDAAAIVSTQLAESSRRSSIVEAELAETKDNLLFASFTVEEKDKNLVASGDELNKANDMNLQLTDQIKSLESKVASLEVTNRDLVADVENLALQAESAELQEKLQDSASAIMTTLSTELAETNLRSSTLEKELSETKEKLAQETVDAEDRDRLLEENRKELEIARSSIAKVDEENRQMQTHIAALEQEASTQLETLGRSVSVESAEQPWRLSGLEKARMVNLMLMEENHQLKESNYDLQTRLESLESTNTELVAEVETLAEQAESVELEGALQRSATTIASLQLTESVKKGSAQEEEINRLMEEVLSLEAANKELSEIQQEAINAKETSEQSNVELRETVSSLEQQLNEASKQDAEMQKKLSEEIERALLSQDEMVAVRAELETTALALQASDEKGKELQSQVNDIENSRQAMIDKSHSLENENRSLKEDIQSLHESMESMQRELDESTRSAAAELSSVGKEFDDHKARLQDADSENKGLREKVKGLEVALNELAAATKAQLQGLQAELELMEASKNEILHENEVLKEQKAKLDTLEEKVKTLEEEQRLSEVTTTALKDEIDTLQGALENSHSAERNGRAEVDSLQTELEASRSAEKEGLICIEELTAQVQKLQEEAREFEAIRQRSQDELDALKMNYAIKEEELANQTKELVERKVATEQEYETVKSQLERSSDEFRIELAQCQSDLKASQAENKLLQAKCLDWEQELSYANTKYQSIESEQNELCIELGQSQSDLKASQAENKQLQEQRVELEQELSDVNTKYEAIQSEHNELCIELGQCQSDLKSSQAGSKQLQEKCVELEEELSDANTKYQSIESEQNELCIQLGQCQSDLDAREADNKQLQEKCVELEQELSDANTKYQSIESEQNELCIQLGQCQSDLDAREADNKQLQEKCVELEQQLSEAKTNYQSIESEQNELCIELGQCQSDLKASQAENKLLQDKCVGSEQQLCDTNTRYQVIETEMNQYRNELDQCRNDLAASKEECEQRRSDWNGIQEENKLLQDKCIALEQQLSDVDQQLSDVNTKYQSMETVKKEFRIKLDQFNKDLESSKGENELLKNQCVELEQQLSNANTKYKALEAERNDRGMSLRSTTKESSSELDDLGIQKEEQETESFLQKLKEYEDKCESYQKELEEIKSRTGEKAKLEGSHGSPVSGSNIDDEVQDRGIRSRSILHSCPVDDDQQAAQGSDKNPSLDFAVEDPGAEVKTQRISRSLAQDEIAQERSLVSDTDSRDSQPRAESDDDLAHSEAKSHVGLNELQETLLKTQSELHDTRCRNADLAERVNTLEVDINSLTGQNQELMNEVNSSERRASLELLPKLKGQLNDSTCRESYLLRELVTLKSGLQQDRHLISCLSTELYDSTSRETELRRELAICLSKLNVKGKQNGEEKNESIGISTDDTAPQQEREREDTSGPRALVDFGNQKDPTMVDAAANLYEIKVEETTHLTPANADIAFGAQILQTRSFGSSTHGDFTCEASHQDDMFTGDLTDQVNEELSDQVELLQTRIKELEDSRKQEIKAARREKSKKVNERYGKMKSALTSLTGVLNELTKSNQALSVRVAELEVELEDKESERQILKKRLASYEARDQTQRTASKSIVPARQAATFSQTTTFEGFCEDIREKLCSQTTGEGSEAPVSDLDYARSLNDEMMTKVEELENVVEKLLSEKRIAEDENSQLQRMVQEYKEAQDAAKEKMDRSQVDDAEDENAWLRTEVQECKKAVDATKEKLERSQVEEGRWRAKCEIAESELKTMEASLRDEIQACKKELEDEKFCSAAIKEAIVTLNNDNDRLLAEKQNLVEELEGNRQSNYENRVSEEGDWEKENRVLSEECKFLRQQKKQFARERVDMELKLRRSEQEKEQIIAGEAEIKARVEVLVKASEELQRSLVRMEAKHAEEMKGILEEKKWMGDKLAGAQKSILDVSSKTKTLRAKLTSENDELRENEKRLTKEVMTLRSSLAECKQEITELEEDLEINRHEAKTVVEDLRAREDKLQAENIRLMNALERRRSEENVPAKALDADQIVEEKSNTGKGIPTASSELDDEILRSDKEGAVEGRAFEQNTSMDTTRQESTDELVEGDENLKKDMSLWFD